MEISSEAHMIYKMMNAAILDYPYPHFHIDSIFDEKTYNEILSNIPNDENYLALNETSRVGVSRSSTERVSKTADVYKERFIIEMDTSSLIKLPEEKRDFWIGFCKWFIGENFLNALLFKFQPYIKERMASLKSEKTVQASGLITRDKTGYSIGPHTDAPRKLLTLLFYLPKDSSLSHLGTSIYQPRKSAFTCEGGPHYSFDNFNKVFTAPFSPNSLFCFFKTNNSFHGVDLITDQNVARDLVIYNVNILDS